MNKLFTLRRATLFLALTLPGASWGFVPSSRNALIVTETGSRVQKGIDSVVAFLSGRLTAATYTVTTHVGLPDGGLSDYAQVWDIRGDSALGNPEISAYVAYMAGGGALFAMGENGSCCKARNVSIAALISAAGGGGVTVAAGSRNAQTVQAPFTGPVGLSKLVYGSAGGFSSSGSGAFLTTDTARTGAAVVFAPGTMTNAQAGALASVLDLNFMDPEDGIGVSEPLTDNLIAYAGRLTAVGPVPTAPARPSVSLILSGLAIIALSGIHKRRKAQTAA